MADTIPQAPAPAQPSFEDVFNELVAALVEGGASPQEAVQAVEQAVAPTPRRAAAIPFELPASPGVATPNALSDDFSTADIAQKMRAEQARRELRGPQPPGPIGPGGREVEMPEGTPVEDASFYRRNIQPYPVDIPAAARGLLMSTGMTGGPQGAVTGALRHGGEVIARSPLARTLAGTGGASAAATPTTVGSAEDALGSMTKQLDALIKQREAAQAERESQVRGDKSKGIAAGRGKNYEAANEELRRMDDAISKLGKRIEIEQYNRSPAGVLEAETKRRDFEKQKEREEFGKPIREHLPPWLADSIPIVATGAGLAGMLALKGRANKEYGRALEGYTTAEKAGDVPAMALRQNQLTQLENPSWANKLGTAATAGIPLELQGLELGIDANKSPDSRASQEAWATIKDPAKMAFLLGRAALGTGVAYGAGSKFAPFQPDRSLGRAIAQGNPYAGAGALVDDLGGAIAAGENLRRLRQSSPGGEALGANPPTPSVANVLSQPSPTQRQLPAPEASPSPPQSSKRTPEGVSRTPWGLRDDEKGRWASDPRKKPKP